MDADRTPFEQPSHKASEEIEELGAALDLTNNARGNAAEGNRGRT